MTTLTPLQTLIAEAAEDAGVEFRAGYSGRGMCGCKCIGLVGTMAEIQGVISNVHISLTREIVAEAQDGDPEQFNAFLNQAIKNLSLLGRAQTDSMGLRTILYWERLKPLEGQQDIEPAVDEEDNRRFVDR